MFSRRNLLKSLFGLIVAPKIVTETSVPKSPLGYKGRVFFDKGIIYAPYIPLLKIIK